MEKGEILTHYHSIQTKGKVRDRESTTDPTWFLRDGIGSDRIYEIIVSHK